MAKLLKDDLLKERSRNWNLILYEEDSSHMSALDFIKSNLKCAYILHDKDIKDVDTGEVKKPHYHVVISFPNPRTRNSVVKLLNIEYNYIDKTNDINKSLEYLIHFNNVDKFQYNINEVYGELKVKLSELINKKDKTEGQSVLEVFDYIDSCGLLSIRSLSRWCATNGYWSEYRRSQTIMLSYLKEHNENLRD